MLFLCPGDLLASFKTAFPELSWVCWRERWLAYLKTFKVQLKFNHEMLISFSFGVHRIVAHHLA